MKSCPQCKTKYTDDTLEYCLQDGGMLVDEYEESAPAETVAFRDTETDTIVSHNRGERITVDINDSSGRNRETDQKVTSSIKPRAESPGILVAVLLTAVGMSLLFGVIGIGAYIYFYYQTKEVASNSNVSSSPGATDQNSNIEAPIGSNVVFDLPTPIATPKTTPMPGATKLPTPTLPAPTHRPVPVENPGIARKRVASRIQRWKTFAEYRNLNSLMTFYTNNIDYYTRRGVSRSFVRRDKQRAFSKYTSIRIRITRMQVRILSGGARAVADFDKEWSFANNRQASSGKVRSRLVMIRKGDNWFIRSERDLKVYYVRR